MRALSTAKRSAVLITSAFVVVVALIGDTLPLNLENPIKRPRRRFLPRDGRAVRGATS